MLGFFYRRYTKRNQDVIPFSPSERHIQNLTHMCGFMSNRYDYYKLIVCVTAPMNYHDRTYDSIRLCKCRWLELVVTTRLVLSIRERYSIVEIPM